MPLRRWFRFSSTSLCVFATLSACRRRSCRSELHRLQAGRDRFSNRPTRHRQGLAGVIPGAPAGRQPAEGRPWDGRRLDLSPEPVRADDLFLIGSTTRTADGPRWPADWSSEGGDRLDHHAGRGPAQTSRPPCGRSIIRHAGAVAPTTEAASWPSPAATDDDRFAAVLDGAAPPVANHLGRAQSASSQPGCWPGPPAGVTPWPRPHCSNARWRASHGLMLEAPCYSATPNLLQRADWPSPGDPELNWVGADQACSSRPSVTRRQAGATQGPLLPLDSTRWHVGPKCCKQPAPASASDPSRLRPLAAMAPQDLARRTHATLADGYVQRLRRSPPAATRWAGHSTGDRQPRRARP